MQKTLTLLFNKKNFRCPNGKCCIAVTCANLEKPKAARKVDPYFRSVEDHKENCPFAVEESRDIEPKLRILLRRC